MTNLNPEYRRAMIAKIKIAQKDLAMDDAAYRALLTRVTGKNSAAVLDKGELEAVIREMQRLGFRPVNQQGTRPRVSDGKKRTLAKISAILRELWQGKLTQGQALKRLRIEMLGLKQAQFAKLVGISLPSLSNLENDRAVSIELINKAFKPFGLQANLVPMQFDDMETLFQAA